MHVTLYGINAWLPVYQCLSCMSHYGMVPMHVVLIHVTVWHGTNARTTMAWHQYMSHYSYMAWYQYTSHYGMVLTYTSHYRRMVPMHMYKHDSNACHTIATIICDRACKNQPCERKIHLVRNS